MHFNPVDPTETKSFIVWFEFTLLSHIYSFEKADSKTKPWNCTSKRLFQNKQEGEKLSHFKYDAMCSGFPQRIIVCLIPPHA